jgi:Zn-dependent oligopeptidase
VDHIVVLGGDHLNNGYPRTDHVENHGGEIVKCMDTLSDMLCSVMDTAEVVRNVHPSRAWIQATNEVYQTLGSFIHQLNTDTRLLKVTDFHHIVV